MDIQLGVSERIATIVLARPPVNALSSGMMRELIDALSTVDADPDVRAVVITGQGRCFSAGVDLKEQLDALESDSAGPASLGVALYEALLHGRKPTIAAVNGPALGAGLGIAASCCILTASESAIFGIPEVNVGMLGGARHAMRLLGHSTVNRMLLTGFQLTADELYRRGAIECCVRECELLPFAYGIARDIAERDVKAVELARASLAQVEGMGVLDGYRHEMQAAEELGRSSEARDAMRRFVGGRR